MTANRFQLRAYLSSVYLFKCVLSAHLNECYGNVDHFSSTPNGYVYFLYARVHIKCTHFTPSLQDTLNVH